MSDATKAVFLSYASQDAEAAKLIADALRAAGVEVWFDTDGGLEHGDEWDAKIRRQIKECVLFLPIISANTQAREEGYFRIEWDLAAERARGIASGVAFILPVVVDDTREPAALVPDRFRTVQWTKLPGGMIPPEVLQRFLKLWSHRTGVLKHKSEEQGAGSREIQTQYPEPGTQNRVQRPRWLAPVIAGGAVAVLALVLARPWERTSSSRPPAVSLSNPSNGLSEAHSFVAKVWAQLNKAELARAELEVADGLAKRATELDPNDAGAWAAWSQVDSWYVYHNFDDSQSRREGARTKAARALQIAPGSYESRLAQACYLVRSVGGLGSGTSMFDDEAKNLLTALLQEKPTEPRALLALGILQRNTGQAAAARGTFEKLAENPVFAALAWNEIAWAAYLANDFRAADSAVDRSIALQACWPNLVLKVILAESWTGNLDEAKAMLEKIPVSVRQEDHGVAMACELYWLRREPENMLRVLEGVSRDWLRSNAYDGPKAFWAGLAHTLAGRQESAQLQWQAALQQVEQRLAGQPDSGNLLNLKGRLLAHLGRREEAERVLRLSRDSGTGAGDYRSRMGQIIDQILLGQEEAALALLESTDSPAAYYRHNPTLDPLRANPRFQAVLARLEADPRYSPKAAQKTENREPSFAKSVAVLAFANLSDDKGNEYFSDGISEELLNVLAKIPGLKVTARTSSFHFKGKDTPVPEIAQQLGVAYVVEGSVRKQGDKVRITAQLIKAADGFHVWSDTFTRDLKDIFAVQDEIAGLVAKNLSLKLGVSTGAGAAGVNPEAYRLYLEGREAWNRRDAEGFQRAELLFNRAIEIEPRFARAHAALADVWILLPSSTVGTFSQRHSPMIERTVAKAAQAVSLDNNSAEAHAALGHVLAQAWRLPEALRELRRAVELNPNYASAHQWLGRALLMEGELDEGVEALRLAAELDPLSHRILDNYADALGNAGRLTESLAVLDRARALHPTGVQIRCKQVLTLARLNRRSEALAAASALAADAQAEESDYRYSVTAAAFAIFGETVEAEAWLRRISPDSEDLPIARAYTGHVREFVQNLDDLIIDWLNNLWFDPLFASIRADPGLREWTKRTGVHDGLVRAEAWLATHRPENAPVKP